MCVCLVFVPLLGTCIYSHVARVWQGLGSTALSSNLHVLGLGIMLLMAFSLLLAMLSRYTVPQGYLEMMTQGTFFFLAEGTSQHLQSCGNGCGHTLSPSVGPDQPLVFPVRTPGPGLSLLLGSLDTH